MLILLFFPLGNLNTCLGSLLRVSGQHWSASTSQPQCKSTLEAPASKDASGVILVDLDAVGHKFAANF